MTKTPAKYTKKPVTITAVQWTGSYTERPVIRATQIIKWILENGGTARYVDRGEDHPLRYKEEIEGEYEGKLYPYRSAPPFIVIKTLEGDHRMDLQDWAIMGVEGEFYPCKPQIFIKSYTPGDASKLMPLKDASIPQLVEAIREQLDAMIPGWNEVDSTDQAAVDAHVAKLMAEPEEPKSGFDDTKHLGSYGSELR